MENAPASVEMSGLDWRISAKRVIIVTPNPYPTFLVARHSLIYPANPNGSPLGLTGFTTRDGRVTIMMPHPERVFRSVQNSWHPDDWGEDGPWLRMFRNARAWVG